MRIYFAADHAGFELKNALVEYVKELGHEAEDCGAHSFDKDDDYPAIIAGAAKKLAADAAVGKESRAIILGGSGQGEAIVANRFKGVRSAVYYGKKPSIPPLSREHNDANALSLGARFLSVDEAKSVVKEWLARPFSQDERHARRIKQIDELIN